MNDEPNCSQEGCGAYGTNYATFKWDGGVWKLIENCCNYGCDPVEPDVDGTYPGEIVHTSCRLSRKA